MFGNFGAVCGGGTASLSIPDYMQALPCRYVFDAETFYSIKTFVVSIHCSAAKVFENLMVDVCKREAATTRQRCSRHTNGFSEIFVVMKATVKWLEE